MTDQTVKTGQYIVSLIRSVLKNEPSPEKPGDVSFEDVFRMSRKHMISVMTYAAVKNLQEKPEEELLNKWSSSASLNIAQSVVQLSEREMIYQTLDQHQISFVPLKGCIVKEMYPKPEYREMSDLDILVKRTDAEKLRPVMEELGYRCDSFGIEKDDQYAKDPFMHVEMHFELLSQDEVWYYQQHEGYSAAIMEPWTKARKISDHRYEMRPEDMYLHMVTHLYKHFKGAGTGIRQVTDLYVVDHACLLDREYIDHELQALGLSEFHEKIMNVLKVWYEDAEPTEETDAASAYIFGAGSYGNHSTRVVHRIADMKKDDPSASMPVMKYLLLRVFPPYEEMCRWYPLVRKSKLLLPAMWIYRLCYKGRTQMNRAVVELKTVRKIMSDQKKNGKR
ncbi:MAG: nucleotidyltransferase family protein [Erysipelotrichaceae bacterium]|nr:nucleotidyltransferase family protein [Erysipelotrichaceae bacterium]